MAKYHNSLIEDKPSAGHMGIAVGYLTQADKNVKQGLDNKTTMQEMTGLLKERLQNLSNSISNDLAAYKQRNDQIYKNKVLDASELPGTPPLTTNITIAAVKPPLLAQELEDEKNFEGFMTEE